MKIPMTTLGIIGAILFFFSMVGVSQAVSPEINKSNSKKSLGGMNKMKGIPAGSTKSMGGMNKMRGRAGKIVSGTGLRQKNPTKKSQDKLQDLESQIKSKRESQEDQNQMENFRLQQEMSEYNQAESVKSQMMKKQHDSQKNISDKFK